ASSTRALSEPTSMEVSSSVRTTAGAQTLSTGGTEPKDSPRRPRVLHVVYSFLLGGSELLARSLVQAIPHYSHGVISVDLPGPLQQEFEDLGARTWCAHREQTSFFQATRAVQAAVADFSPEVVHCHHLH